MRGISPLVAVIMLVAFVLVVAGLVFSWLSTFVTTQREEFQFCSKAGISIEKAYYNEKTRNINIVVYNDGRVPLTGFSVMISKNKGLDILPFKDKTIDVNDIGLFPVPYEENTTEFIVQSIQCKGAQDMVTIYDVEGVGNV